MSKLYDELQKLLDEEEKLNDKKKSILKRIDSARSTKTIECACCKKKHRIRDLTFVQTYWLFTDSNYNRTTYWKPGEGRFVCPTTNIHNRILFFDFDIPYEFRYDRQYSPDLIFKEKFKRLFKEVVELKNEDEVFDKRKIPWTNCYYVDKNRAKFELPEKGTKP